MREHEPFFPKVSFSLALNGLARTWDLRKELETVCWEVGGGNGRNGCWTLRGESAKGWSGMGGISCGISAETSLGGGTGSQSVTMAVKMKLSALLWQVSPPLYSQGLLFSWRVCFFTSKIRDKHREIVAVALRCAWAPG
jgi:hypothetical protein